MLPEDYAVVVGGVDCFVCITEAGGDEWILGNTFMRGFYVSHSYEDNTFGIAPHALSTKTAGAAGSVPDQSAGYHRWWIWLLVGIVVAAVIAVLLWLYVFKKDDDEKPKKKGVPEHFVTDGATRLRILVLR